MKTGLRAANVRRSRTVLFSFDGRELSGHEGESVAAALYAAGLKTLGTDGRGAARGAFCMIGLCQQCVVEIGGRRIEACRATVSEGLRVRSVAGRAGQ